jgi:AcrR family transcriptional regulator
LAKVSRKSPSTSRGQRTRKRLLDAAEDIFGKKGFENTSVYEITQKAGVAQGTFYIYFPDKKSIFTELVKELNHLVREELAVATEGITSRIDVEKAGFKAFFNFIVKRPNLYRIIRQAEFVDEDIFKWHYDRFSKGYMRHLSSAARNGQVKDIDRETLAYCFMGISEFIGMRWCLWEKKMPPARVLNALATLIAEGIERK